MNLRQKPSGIWVVDYEDENGVRRRVSTAMRDKGKATARAREIILGIDVAPAPAEQAPKGGSQDARGITMKAVFDLCQKGNGPWAPHNAKSQATIRSNLKVLEPLVGHLLATEVSYRKLEEAQATLLARYKPATVKRKMDMVGRALTYAMAQDYIASRPSMPGLKGADTQRTRVLTREEEAELFARIAKRQTTEPQRPWVRFGHLLRWLLDLGCRLGEALAAGPGWIESHQGRPILHIPAAATKTGKARVLPLSSGCVESLAYLRITAVGGRLFPMTPGTAWYMFSNLKEEIEADLGWDLGDVVLHTMRHTCITRLLQGGLPLVKVSKWAGHANIKITAGIYGHLEIGDLMDGLDIIDSVPAAEPALKAVSA